jgi:hypothetical protein
MHRGIWILGGSAACLGLLALAHAPAGAAKPVVIEKELLGIRILQSYKDVLAKYGAPHRIYRAGEVVHPDEAFNLQGELTGGVKGLADDVSTGGSGGGPGGYPGGSGGYPGGPGGYPGLPGGGNKGGGPSSGGGTLPPPGGGGGGPASGGGTLPPPGGGGGSPAGGLGGGLPGSGESSDDPNTTFGESGGFSWAYVYPGKELMYQFVFNRDGRVIAILERGRFFGQSTKRGISLGDPVSKVYSAYGWTDSLKDESPMLQLFYNERYHTQFMTLKNKVVGIAVFLKEDQFLRYGGSGGGSGGPAGSPGGPGGYPGLPGGGNKGGGPSKGSGTLPPPGG